MLSKEHSTSTPAASLQESVIEMAGQLVHPDKIQTAAHKIWLTRNMQWIADGSGEKSNQPINQSSQMPPAPTPIQATVRSPNRRDIQKAVRCHAAEQFNLIRATDLILIAISLRRCENFKSELQTKKRDYNRRCTDDLLEAIDEMLVLHQLRQKRSNQDPFPTYVIISVSI